MGCVCVCGGVSFEVQATLVFIFFLCQFFFFFACLLLVHCALYTYYMIRSIQFTQADYKIQRTPWQFYKVIMSMNGIHITANGVKCICSFAHEILCNSCERFLTSPNEYAKRKLLLSCNFSMNFFLFMWEIFVSIGCWMRHQQLAHCSCVDDKLPFETGENEKRALNLEHTLALFHVNKSVCTLASNKSTF